VLLLFLAPLLLLPPLRLLPPFGFRPLRFALAVLLGWLLRDAHERTKHGI
jgi:hypothetical protein